jgi:plasmid maintenance system antidote protein VapI
VTIISLPPSSTTARFWLNLQAQYDLDVETDRLGKRLDHEVTAPAG